MKVAIQVKATIPMLCRDCNTNFAAGQFFDFDPTPFYNKGKIKCPNCGAWSEVSVETSE